jgi:hypothetical protein
MVSIWFTKTKLLRWVAVVMAGQATYILLPSELRLTQINRTKWEQGRLWWEPHAFERMFRCKKRHPLMAELKPKMVEFYLDQDLVRAHVPDTVGPEERPIVPTYQDESTYNANDGLSEGWATEEWYPLRPKGEGAGINVSDFITPAGRLRAPQGTHPDRLPKFGLAEGWRMDASQAAMVLECGKGTWWNSDRLIEQLQEVTIPLFNLAFPGCQALFIFDNATLHRSYKDDALRARNVNLYPGGKQAIMRSGRDHRTGREQVMVLPDGQAKGAKMILQERGLWDEGLLVPYEWHCALGHTNARNIKLLGKDPAVSGIKITGGDMPPCEDCMKGKKTVSISRGPPAQPTTQPLELIHIDTDGPWQVGLFKRPGNISPIPAGSVHFPAITDDFTGYVWVYFYKEKSQFLSCLKHFKPMVENQRKDGLKIQRARMDGAKEFSSHEAEALMKERDERQ